MRVLSSLFAALSIAAIACQESTAARSERSIGFIENEPADRVISAPSTVTAGQAFDVTVTTYGNSCVSAAGADVEIDGITARITPYDFRRTDQTCLDYSAPYPRTVQLRFDLSGEGIIRVSGRSHQSSQLVTVQRSVFVRP